MAESDFERIMRESWASSRVNVANDYLSIKRDLAARDEFVEDLSTVAALLTVALHVKEK